MRIAGIHRILAASAGIERDALSGVRRADQCLPRAIGGRAASVAMAAILLTCAMAAPVLLAPNERIFGNEIVGRHHDPFTVMQQFAGAAVPAPYLQPGTDWIGRVLATALPPVAAYNVVVLATFPLAAVFAYLLAFDITRSTLASAVAGLAFAFSPFHLAHAAYHPHVAQVHWIPFFLFAVWRSVHGITAARGVLLGLATVLVCASNFYGGLIAIALMPAVIVLFWITPSPGGRERRSRDLVGTALVLAATVALGLAAVYAFAPAVLERPDQFAVALENLFLFSVRWWAHFVPPVDHPVLGSWSLALWARYGIGTALLEQQVYLGVGLTTLAAVAGARWLYRRDPELHAVPVLAALALGALLCALSPERIVLGVPTVRPSAALYALAPMFRSYARFSVVVQLMVALLAGIGAQRLWRSRAYAARGLAIGLLALAVFEYAPVPWRWRDVLPTSAHRLLAAQDRSPRVFECSHPALGERSTAWLAGFPIVYATQLRADCGASSLGPQLNAAGITHLIVRSDAPAWRLLLGRARTGLRASYRDAHSAIFEVEARSPSPFLAAAAGWYPREFAAAKTWRWSSGRAMLTAWNPAPGAEDVILMLELTSFAIPRHVEVTLNGSRIARLLVHARATMYALGPVALPPGPSELTLRSEEPPVAPASLGHQADDPRPLAFSVGEWAVGGAAECARPPCRSDSTNPDSE